MRQHFNRDGYVVVPNVISGDALAAVMTECRAIFRLQMKRHGVAEASCDAAGFDSALARLFAASMASYLGAARLTQYLPSLHRLGVDTPLLDLMRRIGIERPVISTRPVMHIVSDALVVPDGYHRTPPHQDWRSVQGSLDAVTAWLPLVPVASGRNTLEVIPGSHRLGLLPAVPHPFGTEVEAERIDETAFVPVQASPGDVVLFSMFLVHRTGAGRGEAARWAASFRYNNLDEPSFVDRDYPNPYIYKPRDDLLFDGFPTASDLRRVFGGK
jgi:ectoine hydroxylase-related dioxygenase (phytanoyl-CoA dioxygenase family)